MKKTPKHVGIIMDGNRRWAREKDMPVYKGHWHGAERILEIAEHCIKRGVKILTLYAFSIENWSRPQAEIDYLMKLAVLFFQQKLKEFHRKGIKIQVIGQRQKLKMGIQKIIHEAERVTRTNNKLILNLAISYGGREEIIRAVREMIREGIPAEKIDEKELRSHLYTSDLPDPDLIIRTSGEQRLSGFLLWQSAYSELYFTKKYWPDFTKEDFDKALAEFDRRQRRFGK